jgi:hypothetical protein
MKIGVRQMFHTHFAKIRPRARWDEDAGPKLSPLESLIYSLISNDELYTRQRIVNTYLAELKNKPGEYKGLPHLTSVIDDAIDDLVKQGYLKEIHGVRLVKFINSF